MKEVLRPWNGERPKWWWEELKSTAWRRLIRGRRLCQQEWKWRMGKKPHSSWRKGGQTNEKQWHKWEVKRIRWKSIRWQKKLCLWDKRRNLGCQRKRMPLKEGCQHKRMPWRKFANTRECPEGRKEAKQRSQRKEGLEAREEGKVVREGDSLSQSIGKEEANVLVEERRAEVFVEREKSWSVHRRRRAEDARWELSSAKSEHWVEV
jgi:hypothetical protein